MIKVVSAYRWIFSLVVSRPFGYDQVSICSFWVVDRFVAPSRPFGYESLVSALQSGTRLGSLARVESSTLSRAEDSSTLSSHPNPSPRVVRRIPPTLSSHQIPIRRSFGGFLHAELPSNGFRDRHDYGILAGWYYSIWLVLACRSSSLCLNSRVSPGVDGCCVYRRAMDLKD